VSHPENFSSELCEGEAPTIKLLHRRGIFYSPAVWARVVEVTHFTPQVAFGALDETTMRRGWRSVVLTARKTNAFAGRCHLSVMMRMIAEDNHAVWVNVVVLFLRPIQYCLHRTRRDGLHRPCCSRTVLPRIQSVRPFKGQVCVQKNYEWMWGLFAHCIVDQFPESQIRFFDGLSGSAQTPERCLLLASIDRTCPVAVCLTVNSG
jgi:hypothetical protein